MPQLERRGPMDRGCFLGFKASGCAALKRDFSGHVCPQQLLALGVVLENKTVLCRSMCV